MNNYETGVERGSGNVFADLGLPNPEERRAKSFIAMHITRLIDREHLTQTQAAERVGVSQPDISNILRGRLRGFTLERLISCLNRLDQDVEITIRPKDPHRSQGQVLVACEE